MWEEGTSEGEAVRAVGRGRRLGLRRAESRVLLPSVAGAVQPLLRLVRIFRK